MAFGFKKKKKEEAAEGEAKEGEGGDKEEAKEEKPEGEAKEGEAKGGEEGKEGEGGEAAGEGDAKAKKKKKLIIIGAGVMMVLVMAGAGVFFSGVLGGGEHAEGEEAAAEGEEMPAGAPVFFDLPPLLVNLNTGGKSASFMKATVTLELANEKEVDTVKANLPRLMDNYNTFLREMKASDLYGSAGTYRLREEMLVRANKMLAPVKVKDVLFRELLVQ